MLQRCFMDWGIQERTTLYWSNNNDTNASFISLDMFDLNDRDKSGCVGFNYTNATYVIEDCGEQKQFICMYTEGNS